jgi:hypothetical protein
MATLISGATGVNKVQTGAIETGDMPTGAVLQVVTGTTTTEQSISTTSWTDTNLSLSITPSATTSKIHIQYSFPSVYLTAASTGCSMRILRDTTSLYTPGHGYAIYNGTGIGYWQYGDIALDSPSTASSVTYKIQIRNYNTNTVILCPSSYYKSTITAMEIAG